jgi:sporulation protein YlmC with PRC-barrel domain
VTNVPLQANVQCSDSPCGKSTDVIVNPVTHKVTHFALKDKKLPENPTRLVPIEKVASTTPDQITLKCTRDEVAKMGPFIVTNFIQETGAGQAYAYGGAYVAPYAYGNPSESQYVVNNTGYDAVNEEQIPQGELALTAGMKVEASDGKVGKLDELVLDEKSGEITHIQMREGHLWGKKDVAIPIADIDFSDGETVYLKIDKAAVKTLPAVKVKR